MDPGYIKLHKQGKLAERINAALGALKECRLCPRMCRANRLEDELGFCRTGRLSRVASYNLHFGEETPLVGSKGSGTIFFAQCNLGCVFCQNYDISHEAQGAQEVNKNQLARIMLDLQKAGAHNINFVTPSHVVPQILEALPLAASQGLRVPLVYNTGAYDRVKTLKLLDGVFDIYMPDSKFARPDYADRYCGAKDYPKRARAAIKEMYRQVGNLTMDENGLAVRGLLVRHLVMPDNLAGTEEWMDFLGREISKNTYVNIMDQYRPCGQAFEFPELSRGITPREFKQALKAAEKAGLSRLDERGPGFMLRLWQALQG